MPYKTRMGLLKLNFSDHYIAFHGSLPEMPRILELLKEVNDAGDTLRETIEINNILANPEPRWITWYISAENLNDEELAEIPTIGQFILTWNLVSQNDLDSNYHDINEETELSDSDLIAHKETFKMYSISDIILDQQVYQAFAFDDYGILIQREAPLLLTKAELIADYKVKEYNGKWIN